MADNQIAGTELKELDERSFNTILENYRLSSLIIAEALIVGITRFGPQPKETVDTFFGIELRFIGDFSAEDIGGITKLYAVERITDLNAAMSSFIGLSRTGHLALNMTVMEKILR